MFFHSKHDTTPAREPIAIIGIGCRYPGVADAHTFWQVLSSGRETLVDYPGDRFPELDRFYELSSSENGPPTRRGGFLPKLDEFDAEFFGVSPREAVYLDPQQRLLLEVGYEALEDAGQVRDKLAGTKSGVFAGIWNNDYQAQVNSILGKQEFYVLTGGALFGAASRLSYFFDLQGPEFVINAGCASSLIAVHLACKALRADDCSLALAGGANVILRKEPTLAFKGANALSSDGRCKFGDVSADGFVRSEGAGIVVLKRLSGAQRDGDRIHALILGSAINSDGQSDGFWVSPSQAGQERALRDALRDASVEPSAIGYVEAHGTGTRAGDAAELNALATVIGRDREGSRRCAVGSAKTNIGHSESAAGIAGLIKTTLAIKHRYIPATLNVQQATPSLDWATSGMYLPTQGQRWTEDEPKAIVSSFGLTGSNSYAVLAAAPAGSVADLADPLPLPAFILPLSAGSAESLEAATKLFAERLTEAGDELADICYSAATRRNHLTFRRAVVGRDACELRSRLLQAPGKSSQIHIAGSVDQAPAVVFVFPGQGSQWPGMGRELYGAEPVFRDAIHACELLIQEEAGWSLIEQICDENRALRLELIDVVQPTLFAIEVGLAALWQSWGVEPAAVVGHSMGEVAAAHVAGILTLREAVQIICRRSRLLLRTRGQGAMALIEATIPEAAQAIAGFEDRLSIAVSNSARSTVLSGDPEALEHVLAGLEAKGVFCRKVKVDVASHSPQMDALTDDLLGCLRGIAPKAGDVPFYSTVEGKRIDGVACHAGYWVRNLRRPVLFSQAVQTLMDEGLRAFVEVSPHPLLVPSLEQSFSDSGKAGIALGSLRRKEGERETLFLSVSELFTAGVDLHWDRIYPIGASVDLPRYVWNRKRFWIDLTRESAARRFSEGGHPLTGEGVETADGRWSWISGIGTASFPWMADHAVGGTTLLPASAYVEMAQAAGRVIFRGASFVVEALSLVEALTISATEATSIQLLAVPDGNSLFTLRFFRSAQGPAARRHTTKELACSWGGAPDPGPVVREFLGKRGDDEADWRLFASAAIRAGVPSESADKNQIHTGCPEEQLGTVIPAAEHHSFLRSLGYDFGPAFQCVTGYRMHDESSQGEIRLPNDIESSGYRLHPVLLDGAFQMLGALLLRRNQPLSQIVPVSIEAIRYYTERVEADVLSVRATIRNGSPLSGDVLISDRQGTVLVVVQGLSFRPLESAITDRSDQLMCFLRWRQLPVSERPTSERGMYLVCGREDHPLIEMLRDRGCRVVSCARDEIESVVERLGRDELLRGIVHVWSSESASDFGFENATALCADTLRLITRLDTLASNARLWIVTNGAAGPSTGSAEPVAAWQASLWGVGAVLDKERPALRTTCVDVGSPQGRRLQLDELVRELLSDSQEQRVAFREGVRYVQRLEQDRLGSGQDLSEAGEVRPLRSTERFELRIRQTGALDTFELRAEPRQRVGAGEVEVEVADSALNFIDVATAMGLGQITRSALGLECAGVVTRVGGNVTDLEIGEEVFAVSPNYQAVGLACSDAVIPRELVWKKPDFLTTAEAASIPSVFMTAYYALVRLAHLRAGERVLIHSGAGGVGLAAVQIAKWIGAEIFVTAGSEEKRAFLRGLGIEHVMDSRTLQFGAEVRSRTRSRGVDVVLNSLTGPAIAEGIRSLAPHGRFVEIGKLDIWQNTEIGLRPFLRNLSFFALDLGSFFEERRGEIDSMIREVLQLMQTGALRPLPVTAYPIAKANDAFYLMASAKHIGKVVLHVQGSEAQVHAAVKPVNEEATYLVTGGLGALGLLAAEELVSLGAKHVVLTGRSEPSASAEKTLTALRSSGVAVDVLRCDLSDSRAVEEMLDRVRRTMPPLRGIVHSAGILDDAVLDNMDSARFHKAMAGKAYGAALLDRLTDDLPLDFFILFSSVACVLGSAGQANYAAANSYLDALAADRLRRGRPATSINWGPWSEIGLAAAQSNRGDRLTAHGLYSLQPDEGRRILRRIFAERPTQVVAMRFDADQWSEWYGSPGDARLLEELRGAHRANPNQAPLSLVDELRSADATVAAAMLFEHVRTHAAAVLRLELESVAPKKVFRTMGLDSLLGLELRNRLERTLGLRLSATVIWNFPTVEHLSRHLFEKLELARAAVVMAAVVTDAAEPVVESKTPEAALLAAELKEAEALLQNQ